MKALLIAEKPSLMRTIQSVYQNHKSEIPYECTFVAQAGHLLTLKEPNELDEEMKKWAWETLPFFPEEHGGWKYKIITANDGPSSKAKERYTKIKNEILSGNYDFIIHAGDPDQEGQLLVRLVINSINKKLPVKRFWSNDTTEKKVLEALKNLKDDDNDQMLINLTKAGYVRQHFDYLYGMNFSRAATLQMNGRASVGRVKTWMLAMICKREDEIKNFIPSTEYGVKVDYDKGFSGQLYNPSLEEKGEKDEEKASGYVYFKTEDEANDFIKSLSRNAVVEKCDTKETDTYAPKLFKLATCQIAAGKMGYSAEEVADIIQGLYEKGYLSYPRTDCEYISSNENYGGMLRSAYMVPELKPFIKSITQEKIDKVRTSKKWVNDKALTEHGHSALTPTDKKPNYDEFSQKEKDIYSLISRQFVAIFLPPMKQKKTIVITDIDGNKFRSSGKEVIEKGYTIIFDQKLENNIIPVCNIGESLYVQNTSVEPRTTKCPSHLSDADLIAICEAPHAYLEDKSLKALGKALHIGTPATRSGIIGQLINKDKYIAYQKSGKKKYLVPTENGYAIFQNLKITELCKTDLTAQWEEKLEMIRTGQLKPEALEKDMHAHIISLLNNIKDTKMIQMSAKKKYESIGICPKCSKPLMEGEKGYFCSGYKEGCKIGVIKEILGAKISQEDFLSLINGEEIEKTLKKDSKKWKQKLIYEFNEGKLMFKAYETEESKHKCPNCKETLLDTGRTLKCNCCDFVLWKEICGKQLKEEDITSLITKGSTRLLKGLKSKKGSRFDARVVLNKTKLGTELKFS